MISLSVQFQKKDDPPLLSDEQIKGKKLTEITGSVTVLTRDGGTASGRPDVTLVMENGDEIIVCQTTARLFCLSARTIMARYPDLFEGD